MLYFLFLILIKHDCQTVKCLNVFATSLYLPLMEKKYKKIPLYDWTKTPMM